MNKKKTISESLKDKIVEVDENGDEVVELGETIEDPSIEDEVEETTVENEDEVEETPAEEIPNTLSENNTDSEKEKELVFKTTSDKSSEKPKVEERERIEIPEFQGVMKEPSFQPRVKISDLKIDINSIKIKDMSNPLQLHKNIKQNVKNKPVFQIVATHSGYLAHLSGITVPDMVAISASNLDGIAAKKNIYKIIHSHVENTSVGNISFKEWLEITGVEDYNTFLYGLYCATYPSDNEFKVTCGECEKQTPIVVNNSSLVTTHDSGIALEKVKNILGSCNSVSKLKELSLLNETTRIILPSSKTIIDIKSPSLNDQMELYAKINPQILNNSSYAASLHFFLYTANVYILDLHELEHSGEISYNKVEEIESKLDIIHNLNKDDGVSLSKSIQKEILSHSVNYAIKNVKCTKCESVIKKIDLDMERLLFTQIGKDLREE